MESYMYSLFFDLFVRGLDLRAASASSSQSLYQGSKTSRRRAALGRYVTLDDYIVPVLYRLDTADLDDLTLVPGQGNEAALKDMDIEYLEKLMASALRLRPHRPDLGYPEDGNSPWSLPDSLAAWPSRRR